MMEISISERIKKSCTDCALGCLEAQVTVQKSSLPLWGEIQNHRASLLRELELGDIAALSPIKAGRDAYRAAGKDPSKYRLSSEALLRRILLGKDLYRINNVVEINNLISLESKFPVGSYDTNNLQGPLRFDIADSAESYQGIGKDIINIGNLPVLRDAVGPFGSPTSDSQRAMITAATTKILLCIFSFSGSSHLASTLARATELLKKYADGTNISTYLIE